MGFVGMQPARNPISMAAMRHKMEGGKCKFLTDPPTNDVYDIPLKQICVGSRKCKGYKTKLYSYLSEAYAEDWGLGKYHHYLWGCRNTWITDQYALVFLCNHDDNN